MQGRQTPIILACPFLLRRTAVNYRRTGFVGLLGHPLSFIGSTILSFTLLFLFQLVLCCPQKSSACSFLLSHAGLTDSWFDHTHTLATHTHTHDDTSISGALFGRVYDGLGPHPSTGSLQRQEERPSFSYPRPCQRGFSTPPQSPPSP